MDIHAEDFIEANGWYRIDFRADCYRWECHARLRELPGVQVVFGSFATMTDCVRYGIAVTRNHLDIRVESKEPARPSGAKSV